MITIRSVLVPAILIVLCSSAMAQSTFPTTRTLYVRSFNVNTMAKYDALISAGRQPALGNFVMFPDGSCNITSSTGASTRAATYTIVSSTQIDVTLTPAPGQLTQVVYRFWLTPNTTNSWYGFALFNGVPTFAMRANF